MTDNTKNLPAHSDFDKANELASSTLTQQSQDYPDSDFPVLIWPELQEHADLKQALQSSQQQLYLAAVQEAIDFANSAEALRLYNKQQQEQAALQEKQETDQLNRWQRQDSFWMFCLYAVAIACAVILLSPSSN